MEPEANQEQVKKKSTTWVWGILLLIILVIAAGAFYLFSPSGKSVKNETTQNVEQKAKENSSVQVSPKAEDASAVKSITISGSEFSYSPSTVRVKKGDTVELTFKNTGKFPHDLAVAGLGVITKIIKPGEQDTVKFVADKTGSFEFNCTVGNHTERGMVGTLTVE